MISIFKSWIYGVYSWISAYLRTRVRWSRQVSRNFPNVFYGRDYIPRRDQNACGGIVKVQDLQDRFPNCNYGANILYLVSSALPAYATEMARYAKKYGAKLVVNQNGTAYPGWHGPGWEKTNQPMAQLIEMADYVFYQSNFCKLAADIHLVPRNNRFSILHNPVDTEIFIPRHDKLKGHRLISAGTHNQLYRVKSAVEAIRILTKYIEDIHLTFAGQYFWHPDQDRAREELMKLINDASLNDHISIQGKYAQSEIVGLLQEHHIFLHTKYNDPCPRSVVEALACGLPVVYSKSGGVPELVGQDAGVGIDAPIDWDKIHPPSPAKLAQAVIQVFSHYEKYSAAARKQGMENLDITPWLIQHEVIFQEMVK